MQPVSPTATRYDTGTIILHWATAGLVAAQWIGAQTIDLFPRGPERINARSVHIAVGAMLAALLAALLVGRLLWRATLGRRLPPAASGLAGALARGMHGCLYALLAAMLLSGMLLAWARGDSLFNVVRIPALMPGGRSLAGWVQKIHDTIGWLILALSGAHALVALVHRYVLRDGVLARMTMRG